MRHTSWVKIHPCFQRRTLWGVRGGWIFTHTSGGWMWELTCWDGLRRWQPGCKQWRETRPATTAELCPESQAASDSSWQLITHRHTQFFFTQSLFSSVFICLLFFGWSTMICKQCKIKPSLYAVGENSPINSLKNSWLHKYLNYKTEISWLCQLLFPSCACWRLCTFVKCKIIK